MPLVTTRTMDRAIRDAQGLEHPRRLSLAGTGGDMDYSDFAFGFSISGAVVTVNAGKIIHGKRLPIIVSSKEITVNNDMTYIFVHYVIGALSGTIDSSNIFPSCTETTLDLPLHLWRVNNGVVSIADGGILHLGYFILPEIFS